MSEENQKIELRSEEVEDILGKVPGWLTRNGIILLLAIIAILLLGSWIFKIPDVKKAEISLTSLQPPADIEARADGNIEGLFVSDNEIVKSGQVLAVIENPAEFTGVMNMKSELSDLNLLTKNMPSLKLPVNGSANLGSIQPDYAVFYKSYKDYLEFVDLNYHNRKIELLEKENVQYENYTGNLNTRASIMQEEYQLAEKQYLRDSALYLEGVLSESNYESTKSEMLSKKANWQEIISLKNENEIKIAGIREKILEMELKKQEQSTLLVSSLEEAYNRLKSSISSWEKQYLIVAPIDGQVTFNRIWSENQNVKVNEKVMTIIPGNSEKLIGKINLPLKGSGEVKEGHPVNIKFENFPYLEYGMVKGEVSNISKVPHDDFYTVEVILPNGLTTYYGIEIDFTQNMKGQAEILTDKMRLLQRIFNPVRSAISRQREM